MGDRVGLDIDVGDTAELILFLDKLFDSLNANSKVAPVTKPLKRSVTTSTTHEQIYCLSGKASFQTPPRKILNLQSKGF